MGEKNLLYYGDNLDIMRRYIRDESVDLVYLDPPFNSNATYNVLFREQNGTRAASQIRAFTDTWTWGRESETVFSEIVTAGGGVSECLRAFRTFLGECNMLAYLVMMAPRLVELRRVMKPTASIYLHCDPTASHYLKMLMDAVFGPDNFLNEIIWRRYKRPKGSQHAARRFGTSTDTLLFYGKSDQHKFFADKVEIRLDSYGIEKRYTLSDERGHYYSGPLLRSASMGVRPNLVYEYKGFTPGPEGWRMTREKLSVLDAKGDIFWTESGIPRRKVRLDGNPVTQVDNLWADIEAIGSQAAERLGYPTQKPEALLERIIKASSSEGDTVLDPFCGCGTTISAAQKLGRRWIGIDITHLAINLIRNRLNDTFAEKITFKVIGEPASVPDAEDLSRTDPYQFQWWALGLVGARPEDEKKGADRGIDGRKIFQSGKPGVYESVIISVKAGTTGPAHVRDLKGVLDREKAAIGVLITMRDHTPAMKTEAVTAGFYSTPWGKYPRIQLLTVAELLAGRKIEMPPVHQVDVTFKKAPQLKEKPGETKTLPWSR